MRSKLWLDDVRPAPDETWDVVTTVDAAISCLAYGQYDEVSLDHDLGDTPGVGTGLDVARWIAAMPIRPRIIRIHSMNPVGAQAMRDALTAPRPIFYGENE